MAGLKKLRLKATKQTAMSLNILTFFKNSPFYCAFINFLIVNISTYFSAFL